MKSKWIEFQGKRILYIDLSNFKENNRAFDAELVEVVSTLGQELYSQPQHSVLVLVDLRGTVMTQQVIKGLTDRIADTRKHVRKTAVIGMTGIRGAFLEYFARLAGSGTVGFEEPEAGKHWLVKN
jgi:hypothetical protein